MAYEEKFNIDNIYPKLETILLEGKEFQTDLNELALSEVKP